jgi:hypothetical protein
MNTHQIDRILKRKVDTYLGTFSSNHLPHETGIFVSNTDPCHREGTHWIAIFIDADRRRGEYFDSFGRPPNKLFTDYMNTHCRHWIYNKRQLQSIASKLCGYYCVLYCIFRSRGRDLNSFVNSFTNDTGFNDVLIGRAMRGKTRQ